MDSFDKFEIADCVPTQCWRQRQGEVFEMLKLLAKFDFINIVDDV